MIYFPTKTLLPNYRELPSLYNCYKSFKGRDVYSSYVYWILKNNGIQNIELVRDLSNTRASDAIFFHFDNLDAFNFNTPAKKIQFVSDKPLIGGCNLYLTADLTACTGYSGNINPSLIVEKKYSVELLYFPEPLPVGLKKTTVCFPPKVATCMGLYENIDKDLLYLIEQKEAFIKKYCNTKKKVDMISNIEFRLNCTANNNKGDEDIFFFIRNKEIGYNYAGYKHPNRLFMSFYCNIPGFYNKEPALCAVGTPSKDFIEIDGAYDFVEKLVNYSTSEQYFLDILQNIKSRENENDEQSIVSRFVDITQRLGIS